MQHIKYLTEAGMPKQPAWKTRSHDNWLNPMTMVALFCFKIQHKIEYTNA